MMSIADHPELAPVASVIEIITIKQSISYN